MWSVPWARLHLSCEEVSIIYNMYFQLTFHCHAHQMNYELVTLVIVISHKDIKAVSPPLSSPYFCLHIISSIKIAADIYSAWYTDITSHIEIRMLPTPHPSWPPLSYITCRKYANHIQCIWHLILCTMQG